MNLQLFECRPLGGAIEWVRFAAVDISVAPLMWADLYQRVYKFPCEVDVRPLGGKACRFLVESDPSPRFSAKELPWSG